MTPEREKLLNDTYQKFIDLMLGDAPLDSAYEIAVDNVMGYGTTTDEKIMEIGRLRQLAIDQREQGAGIDISFVINPVFRRISPEQDSALMVDEIDIKMIIDGNENILPLRIGSVLEFIDGSWKVVHMHGSIGVKSDGDTWHKDELKHKMEELQQLVDEKTADLRQKNRELEIEASLEKVRAAAMSMSKSEDLLTVCEILFGELRKLGFDEIRNAMINIHNDDKKTFLNYDYSDAIGKSTTLLNYNAHPVMEKQINQSRKANDAFSEAVYTGKDLESWKEFRKQYGEKDDPRINELTALYYYFYSIGNGTIGISTFSSINEEKLSLLKRFRNVFSLSYQRYSDIVYAEKQARESKIQLALERVRARTMAMHKSEELSEVAALLFEQLTYLGIHHFASGFSIFDKNTQSAQMWWNISPKPFPVDFNASPVLKRVYDTWEEGKPFYINQTSGEEFIRHIEFLRKVFGERVDHFMASTRKKFTDAGKKMPDHMIMHHTFFAYGSLLLNNITPIKEQEILNRFAKVFEQTYTRFLDLQKAEEQAREAQIEAALERVRAKTMAMHKSDELAETSTVIFEQFQLLGIVPHRCGFVIQKEDESMEIWGAVKNDKVYKSYKLGTIQSKAHPIFALGMDEWRRGKPGFFYTLKGKALKDYHEAISISTNISGDFAAKIIEEAKIEYHYNAFFKHGSITTIFHNPPDEGEQSIIRRFASVLEQTYTRFLDLQKAEAQAREAKIEASLERVRSRSIGMHHTSELQEIVNLIALELHKMEMDITGVFLVINNNEINKQFTFWGSSGVAETYVKKAAIPFLARPIYTVLAEATTKGERFFVEKYSREDKIEFFKHLFKYPPYNSSTPEWKNQVLSREGGYTRSVSVFHYTSIFVVNHFGRKLSDADNEILKRFSRVFEQTYTRFLDLQKAEAQAREAQIEAALERVRSKTMSMQRSEELDTVVKTIFDEFDKLNLGMLRCGIGILNKEKRTADVWTTTITEGKNTIQVSGDESMDIHPLLHGAFEAWIRQAEYSYVLEGEDLRNYYKALLNVNFKLPESQSKVSGNESLKQYYHSTFFRHGGLFAFRETPFTDESKVVMKRFSDVINLAYTRFNDLLQAEMQNRIIQAENDRKTKELEEARELQLAMLPKDIPQLRDFEIAVYMKTATEVGGDYYDFSFMHNGSLNIAIGDATGHGMKAGTIVTMIKSLFIANSSTEEITEFFKSTNEAIKNSNLKRMMIAFAMINIYGNNVRVLNAGMPPVYYYKNATGEISELGGHNFPLGAMHKDKYTADKIEISSGDVILMLSDGFPELQNENLEQFGYDRLVNSISKIATKCADEIISELKNEASIWTTKEPEDDITFVVIKVK